MCIPFSRRATLCLVAAVAPALVLFAAPAQAGKSGAKARTQGAGSIKSIRDHRVCKGAWNPWSGQCRPQPYRPG